ncbi:MAG: hypothetical protein ACI81V_001121 [Lentimonas sp.]|jgi:hypothetical protein
MDSSVFTELIQIIISLGILNVWLLRAGKATDYRGGAAKTLKEEFAAYGLPVWVFFTVGTFKLMAALAIFIGIFIPGFTQPGAWVMCVLMIGALLMHLKVKDSIRKSVPAALMLLMSLWLVLR